MNLILFIALSTFVSAQPGSIFVSPKWLDDNLGRNDIVILHIGLSDGYALEHIPGARLISVRNLFISYTEGLSHELPTVAYLDSVFESYGINDHSQIILYYVDDRGVYLASRVYLTLDYLGMGRQTYILEGGLSIWKTAGYSLTNEVLEFETGIFEPNPDTSLLVDATWINDRLQDPNVILIDVRPEEEYSGRSERTHFSRRGHIRGAINIPFYSLMKESNSLEFKSMNELKQLFKTAGVREGREIVVYCGTGLWVCPLYVAVKHLGYNVRFYDGGFEEWSAHKELAITGPVKRRRF